MHVRHTVDINVAVIFLKYWKRPIALRWLKLKRKKGANRCQTLHIAQTY
jgi:hypothetical protein